MADLDENLNPDKPQFPQLPDFIKKAMGIETEPVSETVVGPMTQDEVELWNELNKTRGELVELNAKYKNMAEYFWANMKRTRNIYTKTLRIDDKTGMLMASDGREG